MQLHFLHLSLFEDNKIAEVYSRNGVFNLRLIETPRSNPLDWTPGSSGLVSNAEDYIKFALMLWNGGIYDGKRILSSESISLMSYPHIQSGVLSSQVDGLGFGLGVGVVMNAKKHDKIFAYLVILFNFAAHFLNKE